MKNGKFSEGWKESNGVPRTREKEWSEIYDFLKSTSHKPPYYYKALDSQTTIGSKSKVQA